MAVDGTEKSGKTHFALSGPGPIAVLDIDTGLDGVIQKWQEDKEIYVKDSGVDLDELRRIKDPTKVSKYATQGWERIQNAWDDMLGTARTLVVDNASEMWELLRLARFGKIDHVKPHHYGPVNQEYRSLIRSAYGQNTTNVILLHKVKDEYINNERTGRKARAGFADTGFLVQLNATAWRDRDINVSVPDCFHLTIADSRQNAELAGVDLSGVDLSFPQIAKMVFPDTEIEEWI